MKILLGHNIMKMKEYTLRIPKAMESNFSAQDFYQNLLFINVNGILQVY